MKKLMIAALAVVAVAAVSQASTINWKMASGQYVYDESTTKLKAGTAYLFDSAKVSQEALFAAYSQSTGAFDLSTFKVEGVGAIHNKGITTTGALATGESGAYGDGASDYNLYFAVINSKGDLFISETEVYGSTAGDEGVGVSFKTKTASQGAAKMTSGGYVGTAWYTVPEPTSGLLLLLGVAGLALRRRRA